MVPTDAEAPVAWVKVLVPSPHLTATWEQIHERVMEQWGGDHLSQGKGVV